MKHNESIGCTVTECRHHCKDDSYCTLNKIEVTKHAVTATNVEATDCSSFSQS